MRELISDIQRLATAVEDTRDIDEALKAGAEPICDAIKRQASFDPKIRSGTLNSAISIGKPRNRSVKELNASPLTNGFEKGDAGREITIGIHYKEMGRYQNNRDIGTDTKSGKKKLAYYANPVEFGHGGPAPAPAHPFVRAGFDSRYETAYAEIKNKLTDIIKKNVK